MDMDSGRWTSRPVLATQPRGSSVLHLPASQLPRVSGTSTAESALVGPHVPTELQPHAEAMALRTAFLAYSRLQQQPTSTSPSPQPSSMSVSPAGAPNSSRTPTNDGCGPGGSSGAGPGGSAGGSSGPSMSINQWMRLCSDLGLPDSLGGPLPSTVLQTVHGAYRLHQSSRLHYLGFVQAVAALSSQLRCELLGAVGRHGAALLEFQRHQWKLQLLQQQLQLQRQQQGSQGQLQGPGYMAPRGVRTSKPSCTGAGEDPADATLELAPQDVAKELGTLLQLKETLQKHATQDGAEGSAEGGAGAAAAGWMPREPPPLPPPILLPGELPQQPPHAANPAYAYIASGLGGLYGVGLAVGGEGRVGGAAGSGVGRGVSSSRCQQHLPRKHPQQQHNLGNWVRGSPEAAAAASAETSAAAASAGGITYLQGVPRSKPYAPQLRPLRFMPAGDPPDPGVADSVEPALVDDPDSQSSSLNNGSSSRVRGVDADLGFPLSIALGIRSLTAGASHPSAVVRAGASTSRISGVVPAGDAASQIRLPAVAGASRLTTGEAPGLAPASLASFDSGGSNGSNGGGGRGGGAAAAAPAAHGTYVMAADNGGEVDSGLVAVLLARLERLERSAVSQESRLARVGSRLHGLEVAAATAQQQQEKATAAAVAAAAKAAEDAASLASGAGGVRSDLEARQTALEQQLLQQQSLLLNALATAQAAREDAASATAAAVLADSSAEAAKTLGEEAMSLAATAAARRSSGASMDERRSGVTSATVSEVSDRLLKPLRAEMDEQLQSVLDKHRTLDEQLRELVEQQRRLDEQVAALAVQQQHLASEAARVAAVAARVSASPVSPQPSVADVAEATTAGSGAAASPGAAAAATPAVGSKSGDDNGAISKLAASLEQLRDQVRELHAAQESAAALAAAATAAAAAAPGAVESSRGSEPPHARVSEGCGGCGGCDSGYATSASLKEAEAAWGRALREQKEALEEHLTKALRDAGAATAAAAAAAVAAAGMPPLGASAALQGPAAAVAAAAPLMSRLSAVEGFVADLAEQCRQLSKRQNEAEAAAAAAATAATTGTAAEPPATAAQVKELSAHVEKQYEQLGVRLTGFKLQLEDLRQRVDISAAAPSATCIPPPATEASAPTETAAAAAAAGAAGLAQPRTRTPSPPRPELPLARQPSSPTDAAASGDAAASSAAWDSAELQRRLDSLAAELRHSLEALSSSVSSQMELSRSEVAALVAKEVAQQLAASPAQHADASTSSTASAVGAAPVPDSGGGGGPLVVVASLQERLAALEAVVTDANREVADVCAATDMTTESVELCTKHLQALDNGHRDLQRQVDELRRYQQQQPAAGTAADAADMSRGARSMHSRLDALGDTDGGDLGPGGTGALAELRSQLARLEAANLPARLETAEAALRQLQDGALANIAAAAAAASRAASATPPSAAAMGPDMEKLRQVLLELGGRLDGLAQQVSEHEHGLDVLAKAAETASAVSRGAAARLDVVEASLAGGGGGRMGLAAAASRGSFTSAGPPPELEGRLAEVEKGAATLARRLDDAVRRIDGIDGRLMEAAMDAAAAKAAAAAAGNRAKAAVALSSGRRSEGGTEIAAAGLPPGAYEESPDSYGVIDVGGSGGSQRAGSGGSADVQRLDQEWQARLKTAMKAVEQRMQADRERTGEEVLELQRGLGRLRDKGVTTDELLVKLSRRMDKLEVDQGGSATPYSTLAREHLAAGSSFSAVSHPSSMRSPPPLSPPLGPSASSLSAGLGYRAAAGTTPADMLEGRSASRANLLAARFRDGPGG
ncbi:hypothetical protein Agub_g7711 [Astrephomene gubernaculifera]|uniref:Uncharacterized protein n=1 Tax=Astrephomene gubernaculifera TaxID=47775 RepID=A0AAD3DT71_9CHLO|nr:hypothetical protein Agub_g7711 [Astrephomene gubernaculifera]